MPPRGGYASVDQPAKFYTNQLFVDTVYSIKDLPETIDHGDGWQDRIIELRVTMTWW